MKGANICASIDKVAVIPPRERDVIAIADVTRYFKMASARRDWHERIKISVGYYQEITALSHSPGVNKVSIKQQD